MLPRCVLGKNALKPARCVTGVERGGKIERGLGIERKGPTTTIDKLPNFFKVTNPDC